MGTVQLGKVSTQLAASDPVNDYNKSHDLTPCRLHRLHSTAALRPTEVTTA
jgi:hypothetical protein